jgi:hypothetical protein
MEAISDLPMLNDIAADYTPQHVKLARILTKIESGDYKRGDPVPAAGLAREHKILIKVAWHALAMLAANRYLARPGPFEPCPGPFEPCPGPFDASHAHRRERG